MPTISKENYLKAVYSRVNEVGSGATTSSLAEKLEISNAAISEMAKKLSDEGLITYEKYRGMELTGEGKKIALRVIRRHRLWELFLMNVLDLSWSEVHDEAENLEHSTSDYLIDKIDRYLGYPKFDPHGYPIPQKNGVIPKTPDLVKLKDAISGKKYKVSRVNDANNDMMIYLTKIGMSLSKEIEVVEKLAFDNSVIIKVDSERHSLSELVASNIFVEKVG
ncbi:mn-dependent transcriptional regulator mntr [hydrocarbon metagenome]|uniref:Manganese transport regulator n=1 Tax=hydrocarbon metagenome TaxID=938273 RepID=A0A0W8FYE4_9ZZZZ